MVPISFKFTHFKYPSIKDRNRIPLPVTNAATTNRMAVEIGRTAFDSSSLSHHPFHLSTHFFVTQFTAEFVKFVGVLVSAIARIKGDGCHYSFVASFTCIWSLARLDTRCQEDGATWRKTVVITKNNVDHSS